MPFLQFKSIALPHESAEARRSSRLGNFFKPPLNHCVHSQPSTPEREILFKAAVMMFDKCIFIHSPKVVCLIEKNISL